MKSTFPLLLFILFSCSIPQNKENRKLNPIKLSEIISIEIKEETDDSTAIVLNHNQIEEFISTVNYTKGAEMRKALPKYWILLKTKQDSIKVYKVLDSYIGEWDLYIKTDKANYFQKIYKSKPKDKSTIFISY